MKEQKTYKAARFFGRAATERPQPIWFLTAVRPLFRDATLCDWRTGLPQRRVYYMDAAHRIPIAREVWDCDLEKRQVVKTWHWAIGYGEDWEVADPVSTAHPPAVFESLLQQGRQQILNHLMVRARQALGVEADKAISLLYSRYQRELLSWKQCGIAAAFHRALDADAAQREEGEELAESQGEESEQKEAEAAPQRERATCESEQKEAADISAILNQPLSCEEIPAGLKGKKVIDYLKYHIR